MLAVILRRKGGGTNASEVARRAEGLGGVVGAGVVLQPYDVVEGAGPRADAKYVNAAYMPNQDFKDHTYDEVDDDDAYEEMGDNAGGNAGDLTNSNAGGNDGALDLGQHWAKRCVAMRYESTCEAGRRGSIT